MLVRSWALRSLAVCRRAMTLTTCSLSLTAEVLPNPSGTTSTPSMGVPSEWRLKSVMFVCNTREDCRPILSKIRLLSVWRALLGDAWSSVCVWQWYAKSLYDVSVWPGWQGWWECDVSTDSTSIRWWHWSDPSWHVAATPDGYDDCPRATPSREKVSVSVFVSWQHPTHNDDTTVPFTAFYWQSRLRAVSWPWACFGRDSTRWFSCSKTVRSPGGLSCSATPTAVSFPTTRLERDSSTSCSFSSVSLFDPWWCHSWWMLSSWDSLQPSFVPSPFFGFFSTSVWRHVPSSLCQVVRPAWRVRWVPLSSVHLSRWWVLFVVTCCLQNERDSSSNPSLKPVDVVVRLSLSLQNLARHWESTHFYI